MAYRDYVPFVLQPRVSDTVLAWILIKSPRTTIIVLFWCDDTVPEN